MVKRRIGASFHELYTIKTKKRGLCAFDDKRYLLPDGIHWLAFGHRDIQHTIVDVRAEPDGDVVQDYEEALATGATVGLDEIRLRATNQPGRDPQELEAERKSLLQHFREVRARAHLVRHSMFDRRSAVISVDPADDDPNEGVFENI